ncbi:helix-turn-helix domain-containing protein [Chryseobacterium echinoideorum]|uniref:helix-turn-helix domain-containing protein n=1 Tax=Chryseobacterium echinoideorum TaxID=1549648 RepID=UPI0029393EDD|nr:helix-turn-helix transcriptional regulator [Chryseobacterium echinoideorum]
MMKDILDKESLQKLISNRIKTIRQEKNISQSELGALCNFEKSNMSRIESGRMSPSLITLYRISVALDVEFSELFEFNKVENPSTIKK